MRAPSFTLTDQDGNQVNLSDYAGTSLIVFFYPKAMTPGCTAEACDFRDNHRRLIDAGYEIVGISPDEPERNAKFREKEQLTFPLLSDPAHKVAEAFGAWGMKKNYGREYSASISPSGPMTNVERIRPSYSRP